MNARIKTSAPETICRTADAYIFIYADGLCDELSNDESKEVWQRFQGIAWDEKYVGNSVLFSDVCGKKRASVIFTGVFSNMAIFRVLTRLKQSLDYFKKKQFCRRIVPQLQKMV